MYGSNQLNSRDWKRPRRLLGSGKVEPCLKGIATRRECTVLLLLLRQLLDQMARGGFQIDIPSPKPHIRLHFRQAKPGVLGEGLLLRSGTSGSQTDTCYYRRDETWRCDASARQLSFSRPLRSEPEMRFSYPLHSRS